MTTWTEDRVERLKALWKDGRSASEIAAELGDMSRCAVIGKAHRLKLDARAKPVPKRARPPKRAKNDGGRRANKIAAGTFAKAPQNIPILFQPPPEPVHVPYAGPHYGILDDRLGHLMCRAIVGGSGPTTLFCSAPTVDGPFRFCRDHAAVYVNQPRASGWSEERRQAHIAMLRRRGIAA